MSNEQFKIRQLARGQRAWRLKDRMQNAECKAMTFSLPVSMRERLLDVSNRSALVQTLLENHFKQMDNQS